MVPQMGQGRCEMLLCKRGEGCRAPPETTPWALVHAMPLHLVRQAGVPVWLPRSMRATVQHSSASGEAQAKRSKGAALRPGSPGIQPMPCTPLLMDPAGGGPHRSGGAQGDSSPPGATAAVPQWPRGAISGPPPALPSSPPPCPHRQPAPPAPPRGPGPPRQPSHLSRWGGLPVSHPCSRAREGRGRGGGRRGHGGGEGGGRGERRGRAGRGARAAGEGVLGRSSPGGGWGLGGGWGGGVVILRGRLGWPGLAWGPPVLAWPGSSRHPPTPGTVPAVLAWPGSSVTPPPVTHRRWALPACSPRPSAPPYDVCR